MKRSPFRRRGRFGARATPMPRRRERPRRRGDFEDLGFLAYLRERACRAPATPTHWGGDPHHLRHDENGASLGANVKDDRRAISLCRCHHRDIELGQGPWQGWSRDEIKAWENEQNAQQRRDYLATLTINTATG